ncbi:hypothetical protein GALL_533240 [mine drainage metagenome]|uniref:DUF2442 domain-containing protein n=1 Tax=mine drainage metagenome TaxID=410659 RepID=A0A1J5PBE6_9ZZZZ
MNKVMTVRPMPDGWVFVEMADGRSGEFDVTPYMKGDFFSALVNEAYFSKVRLVFKGIGWPDGQDLGPDTIAAQLGARPGSGLAMQHS